MRVHAHPEADVALPPQSLLGRPGLGVIILENVADGVAYVARLLNRALSDLASGPPRVVELGSRSPQPVRFGKRVRFLTQVLAEQMRDGTDWWLYGHLGVARAYGRVPTPLRKPYAVFLHGIECWTPELAPDRKRALRNADLLIANSHYTAKRVADVHPDIGPVHACPLGLLPTSTEVEPKVDRGLLARIRADSVLIVGRMRANERAKGHDTLVECWPRVLERLPGAQLVVVGNGDDRRRLEAKAAAAGLHDTVLFTGFASDATVEAIRGRVGLFAMPSEGEGFGLVYLEAMRAGLPCIASDDQGAQDVIDHGHTGFLVSRNDPAALTARIVELLTNTELRRAMGTASAERYESMFTYAAFRARLAQLLFPAFGAF